MGLLAIGGAVWALARHCTHQPAPLLAPARGPASPAFDPDAGEIPVPELLQDPADVPH